MSVTTTTEGTAPDPAAHLAALRDTVVAMAGPVDRHDEAERAAEYLARAEKLRQSIAGAVEAAQNELAGIEAECARTVNAARARTNDIRSHAEGIEREAAAAEDTGRSYRAAANFAQLALEAWREGEKLAAERQDALGTADALGARLSDLAALQRAAQTDLDAAKAATDADAAGEARTRLLGLAEVTPGLLAQRDAAAARARAIGTEDSGGEYARILARAAGLVAERERALDAAEPERVEARRAANPIGALLEDISKLTPAERKQVLESWVPPKPQDANKTVRRNAAGHITGNVAGVHHAN